MPPVERYQPGPAVATARELARRWWRAELQVLDGHGAALNPLVSPPNGICAASLASTEGARRCATSIARASEKARDGEGRPAAHECHLGFTLQSAADPGGRSLVACGVRENGVEQAELGRLAERLAELGPVRADKLEPLPGCDAVDRTRLADLLRLSVAELSTPLEPELRKATRIGRRASDSSSPMVGRSLKMLEIQRLIERVAASDSTVLVQGESGTGKELVARQIHEHGARRDRPFVAQNCSALNDNLLESALFGHVRGAFTGATRDTRGLFEVASGGSLLLDEIGDMSPALQVKLLRVLQEGTFTPVGGQEEKRADVRIIAATHKDLAILSQQKLFREDLYYRINVIRLVVPPLREREDDLVLLVDFFLRRFARGKTPPTLHPKARSLLLAYAWPGNVRELQNEIERMCVLAGDETELGPELVSPRIQVVAGPELLAPVPRPPGSPAFDEGPLPKLNDAVERLERALLTEALRRCDGNRSQISRELGIARSNLILKLDKYKLG